MKGIMDLKPDMAKSYDMIEWAFIDYALKVTGFPKIIVNTIMNCVTTITFTILINNNPFKSFFYSRGIRLGDHLSPYLFILCVGVLSSMPTYSQNRGALHGLDITKKSQPYLTFFSLMTFLYFVG